MTDQPDKAPDTPKQPTGKASDTPASDEPSGALNAPTLGDGPHQRDTTSTAPHGQPSAPGRPDQPELRSRGSRGPVTGNPHARGAGSLIREALPAALLALLLAVAVVPVVYAVTWNSKAEPLRVTGYGSIGDGYGTFTVSTRSDGTRFRVHSEQKLTYNADNHKVWTQVLYQTNDGWCFQPPHTACSTPIHDWRWGRTAATNSPDWADGDTSTGAHLNADRARALIRMRLAIPWRPDPASGWTITDAVNY